MSPASMVHEPHKLSWFDTHRTDAGVGRSNRSASCSRARHDVHGSPSLLPRDPLDEMRDVALFVGLRHPRRHLHPHDIADESRRHGLLPPRRADTSTRNGSAIRSRSAR